MSEDLTDVRVSLARMEERQEHTLHRLRNIDQKMDAFATKQDLAATNKRVDDVATTQNWITRSAMAGFTVVMGGFAAVGKKLGIGP